MTITKQVYCIKCGNWSNLDTFYNKKTKQYVHYGQCTNKHCQMHIWLDETGQQVSKRAKELFNNNNNKDFLIKKQTNKDILKDVNQWPYADGRKVFVKTNNKKSLMHYQVIKRLSDDKIIGKTEKQF